MRNKPSGLNIATCSSTCANLFEKQPITRRTSHFLALLARCRRPRWKFIFLTCAAALPHCVRFAYLESGLLGMLGLPSAIWNLELENAISACQRFQQATPHQVWFKRSPVATSFEIRHH